MNITITTHKSVPCSKCGRMDRKHKARGICTVCYAMQYYFKNQEKAKTSQKTQEQA